MTTATIDKVLSEAVWNAEGSALWIKRAVLVVLGIAILAVSAKIKLPIPPSPVPVNMGTFAVLALSAAYGPRLGLATILGYLLVGYAGFNVFTNSSDTNFGWAYMTSSTGGYLVGFVLATLALGFAGRKGWDRNVLLMGIAMIVGNLVIYGFGLAWLHQWIGTSGLYNPETFATPWSQTLAWGVTPFLIGDAIKIALAALLLPALWKLVGKART